MRANLHSYGNNMQHRSSNIFGSIYILSALTPQTKQSYFEFYWCLGLHVDLFKKGKCNCILKNKK